jgi:hypothetical protein
MLEGNLLIGRQVDHEERHPFFPEARGIKLEVVKYPEAKYSFLLLWRKWMGRPQPSSGGPDETCGLLEVIPLSSLYVGVLSLQASKNSRKWDELAQAQFIDRAFTEG